MIMMDMLLMSLMKELLHMPTLLLTQLPCCCSPCCCCSPSGSCCCPPSCSCCCSPSCCFPPSCSCCCSPCCFWSWYCSWTWSCPPWLGYQLISERFYLFLVIFILMRIKDLVNRKSN